MSLFIFGGIESKPLEPIQTAGSFLLPDTITCMIVGEEGFGYNEIIVGLENGNINIYHVYSDSSHALLNTPGLKFNFVKTLNAENLIFNPNFTKHNLLTLKEHNATRVTRLLTLTGDRLFSFSSRKANIDEGKGIARIWQKRYDTFVRVLSSEKVIGFVELPDNLIAISAVTRNLETLQIFDTLTGEQIIFLDCIKHDWNVRGKYLAYTTNGFLAAAGKGLQIWTVRRFRSLKEMEIKNSEAYHRDILALPNGHIAVADYGIRIYQINSKGKANLMSKFPVESTIPILMPLHGFNILTVINGSNFTGKIKTLNIQTQEWSNPKHVFASTILSSAPWWIIVKSIAVLPKKEFFLQTIGREIKFYDFKGKIRTKYDVDIAEIRKNARILAQANRTQNDKSIGLGSLPIKILLEIVRLTRPIERKIRVSEAMKIAKFYFCKP